VSHLTKIETSFVIWQNIVTIVARSVSLSSLTCAKTPTHLSIALYINDGLVNAMPNMQRTLLQCINVAHPRLIGLLLDDAQELVGLVDYVEVRTVLWPHVRWNWNLEKSYSYSVRFAKIRTSKYCKVVRKHTEGVVESIIWVLFEI